MVHAYSLGDSSFKSSIIDEQRIIDVSIRNLDAIDQKAGDRLQTPEQWKVIKEQWKDFEDNWSHMESLESFGSRTGLIKETLTQRITLANNLLNLMDHVSETSGLKLEPDHDNYFLMSSITSRLPQMLEAVSQVRGIASGIAAKHEFTNGERTELIVLEGANQWLTDEFNNSVVTFQRSGLNDQLKSYVQDYVNAEYIFLQYVDYSVINSPQITIKPIDLFMRANKVEHIGYAMYDIEASSLDGLLQERIHQLQIKTYFIIAMSLMVLSVIVYVLLELIRRKQELENLAFHDVLTGLPNRALFNKNVEMAIIQAQRSGTAFALMLLDLDRFKNINDTLGHDFGDLLLISMAKRLSECLRGGNIISRMGGDEFLILVNEIKGVNDAKVVVQKILRHLDKPFNIQIHELVVSSSIGISIFPHDGENIESLIKHADIAMYHAKNSGRSHYQFYELGLNEHGVERLQMEVSLRKALEHEEFVLYYQPQYDMKTGTISGMEALVRWRNPEAGLVPPTEFIALAEETGLIIPLGEWVLRTACVQNKRWQNEGFPPLRMAVNISAAQFQQDVFLNVVRQVLRDSELDPKWLDLEFTESIMMEGSSYTIEKLQTLKELGIQISIDDFGRGFSSLSYLKHFPIDTLKIDGSFVKEVPSAQKDTAIVKTIIALGQRLNLKVVAEGVETEEQLRFLASRNCNVVQGYLISEPLSPVNASLLLHRKTSFENEIAAFINLS